MRSGFTSAIQAERGGRCVSISWMRNRLVQPRSGYVLKPNVAAQRLRWVSMKIIQRNPERVVRFRNPVGVAEMNLGVVPRVAAARQPWALLLNRFAVNLTMYPTITYSPLNSPS